MAGIGGSGKGIQIVVGTDYNDRDLKRAQRDLDQLKAKAAQTASPMQKLGNTLRANMGPALAMAGAAAAAFAVKLAVDGVQAAAAEERQLAILKQTLDNVGQGFAMDQATKFIDDLRFMSGISDDELIPSFQKLVGATKDVSSAQDLLKAAVDASVGSGKDLGSVSQAVAKAVAGSSTALKRLIPELDATAIKGGGAEKVIAALEARFGGSAAAATNTFAGQIQRLQDGFQELTESFGTGFLNAVNDSEAGMRDMAQTLRDLQPQAESLGEAMGNVAIAISGLSKVIDYAKTAWNWMPDWLQGVAKLANNTINPVANFYDILTKVGMATTQSAEAAQLHTEWLTRQQDRVTSTTKAQQLLTNEYNNATPAIATLESGTASYTDALTLLREDIKNTTTRLSALTAAFDEANAAMARREAMQGYRDALKEFIANPSGETRDAVVTAMIDAATAFENPKQSAKFTAEAVDAIIAAAKTAGINVPKDLLNIGTAATTALDPVSSLKRDLYDIPSNIPVVIDIKIPNAGALRDLNGNGIPDAFEAGGGFIDSSRYFANGGRASDTIPAWLTPGEFVIKAPMVKRWGSALFSQLNAGINPLDGMGTSTARRSSGLTINGGVNVMSAPNEPAEQSLPRALRRMAFLAGA